MTEFGFESTTDEVLDGIDLTGRHILVTGASAGLGLETTRALAAHGAAVTMAVRDLTKGAAAMEEVLAAVPDADVDVRPLDLADLSSIRTFAHGFVDDHPRLDVLICNAGVMACPQGTTVDGFETQFGTNHLGHFLLIQLLTPSLVATGHARVVLLSSSGHRFSDVDLDDPGFERQPYDAWQAYGRSKTANVLCAVALDERLRDQGVRAFAVHPGGIATELGRHLTERDPAGPGRPPGPVVGAHPVEDDPAGGRHHGVGGDHADPRGSRGRVPGELRRGRGQHGPERGGRRAELRPRPRPSQGAVGAVRAPGWLRPCDGWRRSGSTYVRCAATTPSRFTPPTPTPPSSSTGTACPGRT